MRPDSLRPYHSDWSHQKSQQNWLKWVIRVGIPKEILTNQGIFFMARVVKRIKYLRTSVYHSQTDGMVRHFNHILKSMLTRYIQGDPRRRGQLLTPLMFAIRKAP